MNWCPRGYGGERRDPEQVKREGWREMGVLAVCASDHRLNWVEKEFITSCTMAVSSGPEGEVK